MKRDDLEHSIHSDIIVTFHMAIFFERRGREKKREKY